VSNHRGIPSFRQQIAIVFNDYMDTLGGGERSALAYAKALQDLEFEVEIVSRRPVPSEEQIELLFGQEFASIPMRQIRTRNLYKFLKAAEPSVFVNHTYMSFEMNPGRLGIYSQMFPGCVVNSITNRRAVKSLATYQLMFSNSSFTKNYADGMWEYPCDRNHVLQPPISSDFVALAGKIKSNPHQKNRTFINLGRFNPGNHNKNQIILIEAFLEAQKTYPSLKAWNFILIGNRNDTPEAVDYLKQCQHLANNSGGSVQILNNVSTEDLSEHLLQSFGYVHGTGAFLPPGVSPEKCEHFGLSIVEAMAHGCMPLVYARGGIFDVAEPGKSCIPYISRQGLVEGFKEIADSYEQQKGRPKNACLDSVGQMGLSAFTEKLLHHIRKTI
jgi:glycosyltransferase involved in cell wall biosynthesis